MEDTLMGDKQDPKKSPVKKTIWGKKGKLPEPDRQALLKAEQHLVRGIKKGGQNPTRGGSDDSR
jgi:hypothetical protein